MGGRIRGHYRIEASGRVMPLTDVNSAMKPFSIPLPLLRDKAAERRSRVTKMSMIGLVLFSSAVAVMAALPQIERSVITAQANRMALVRSAFLRSHPEFRSHHWRDRTAEN